jgi:thioesterase domain-containing protein
MKTKPKTKAERPINDRMRRVCELVVSGHPAGRAYELAGYSARGDVADQAASRLLGSVKVASYLTMLRQAASKQADFSRDDLVGFLVKVIKTPVGQVGQDSDLAQKVKVDMEGGFLVEMPGKIQAAKQLAEIMGWNKPQEVKVDLSEKLADIIGRIRKS